MIIILNIAHPAIVTIVECAYRDINAEMIYRAALI